jgi:hypothetical protein
MLNPFAEDEAEDHHRHEVSDHERAHILGSVMQDPHHLEKYDSAAGSKMDHAERDRTY